MMVACQQLSRGVRGDDANPLGADIDPEKCLADDATAVQDDA